MQERGGDTFTLELATAAQPEDLERWLADAAPRARVIYAQGIDLPRDAAGVQLVQDWIARNLVHPFRERDPHDRRRWRFMAEKCGVGVPADGAEPESGADTAQTSQLAKQKKLVFAELVGAARAAKPCPSNAELAQALQLPRTGRGVRRARYVLDVLAGEGRITIESEAGICTARVVTIASGPWAGASTAHPVQSRRERVKG